MPTRERRRREEVAKKRIALLQFAVQNAAMDLMQSDSSSSEDSCSSSDEDGKSSESESENESSVADEERRQLSEYYRWRRERSDTMMVARGERCSG